MVEFHGYSWNWMWYHSLGFLWFYFPITPYPEFLCNGLCFLSGNCVCQSKTHIFSITQALTMCIDASLSLQICCQRSETCLDFQFKGFIRGISPAALVLRLPCCTGKEGSKWSFLDVYDIIFQTYLNLSLRLCGRDLYKWEILVIVL